MLILVDSQVTESIWGCSVDLVNMLCNTALSMLYTCSVRTLTFDTCYLSLAAWFDGVEHNITQQQQMSTNLWNHPNHKRYPAEFDMTGQNKPQPRIKQ